MTMPRQHHAASEPVQVELKRRGTTQSGRSIVFVAPDDPKAFPTLICLPVSQIEIEYRQDRCLVTMPRWLAEDRGLA